MEYQVYVIEEPYRYYEKSSLTRKLLSDVFKNQLLGYKTYYPAGVCPIGEYDFFTNHIVLVDKISQEILLSFKMLKHTTCKQFHKNYPILSVLGEQNQLHYQEVLKWINKNPNSCYGHGWTMNPNIEKEKRKLLTNITFSLVANFLKSYKLKSHIDISIVPFKIHKIKEWMGNKYLKNLSTFPVAEYGNRDGVIMVNEGLVWSKEYQDVINSYTYLWKNRITISESNIDYEEKLAA